MVAILKPVEAHALKPPVYDNTNLSRREDWILDNFHTLKCWWEDCESHDDQPSRPGDWESFCWCQWDRQTALKHEGKSTLRQHP